MDDRASFAQRRARASAQRRQDVEALRDGRPPARYVLALWFVLSLLATVLAAALAAFGIWFFTWSVVAVVFVVWLVSFVALMIVSRRG